MAGLVTDLLATVKSTFRIKQGTIDASGLSDARTYTLPDSSGTIALTGGAASPTLGQNLMLGAGMFSN